MAFGPLLERGALFTEARYRHGANVTAAGHATIITGQHPSNHGVVGNTWHGKQHGQFVTSVSDSDYLPIGGPGANVLPLNLSVPTIGDMLKEKNQDSKVVAIGTKSRVAVTLAGQKGDAAYWFSNVCGCFITSSYYSAHVTIWLTEFQPENDEDQHLREPWKRLLNAPRLYLERSREDKFYAENGGHDSIFPHSVIFFRFPKVISQ